MTRHGRNATNSAVYTYHERKKDANASGYGSDKCRLGKDSLKGKDMDLFYSMVKFVKLDLSHYIKKHYQFIRQDSNSLKLHNLGYDCCSLTLQPCRTPLVSPAGWLFDKEALLKYIIEKKQEYARKLKEYERQKDRDLKVFYIRFPRKNLYNVNVV